jgi:hypothetical protein
MTGMRSSVPPHATLIVLSICMRTIRSTGAATASAKDGPIDEATIAADQLHSAFEQCLSSGLDLLHQAGFFGLGFFAKTSAL